MSKNRRRNQREKVSISICSDFELFDFVLGRSASRKSTDSPAESATTISTPVTLPKTIIKQDPETIQHELLSFMKRRFGYRPYFKLSEINIGKNRTNFLCFSLEYRAFSY